MQNRSSASSIVYVLVSLSFIYLSLFPSCARVSSPTGGPKDTLAPVLLSSVPIHGAKNYKGRDIALFFDERIELNQLRQNLIVSPTINIPYVHKVRRDKIIITFDEALPDSTTFTFDFGEAIQDVTEKNKTDSLRLTYSTIDYFDTAFISGVVRSLEDNNALKEVSVLLYNANDTFDLNDGKPLYFTRSNEEGHFILPYLKKGKYLMYAIDDKNKNLNYDDDEKVAFLADTLDLDTFIYDQSLQLYPYEIKDFKYFRAVDDAPHVLAKYSHEIIDYTLEFDSAYNDNLYHMIEKEQLRFFWFGDMIEDTIAVIANTKAEHESRLDTLLLAFRPRPERKSKEQFKVSAKTL